LDYNEGNFIALNPDGTVKWSVSIGPVSSRPVLDDAIPEWARGAVSSIEKKGIIVVGGGKTAGPFAPTSLEYCVRCLTLVLMR
jgi:hypothetical protein